MGKSFLYIGSDSATNEIYVGIGESTTRIYELHNPAAQSLLGRASTVLWQTAEPFSTGEDARRAEAAAIKVATLLGRTVVDLNDPAVTNIASTKTSRYLVPAVVRRPGVVFYEELERTAIVTVTPDDLEDGRGAIHGGRRNAELAERARQWWDLAASRGRAIQPRRLIARLKGAGVIVGDWDLDESVPSTGDSFNLVDAENLDPREIRGKRLEMGGRRLSTKVTWSQDIRDLL